MSPERTFLMSKSAQKAIEERARRMRETSAAKHAEIGEAGDDDWHGEFAFEDAQRQSSMLRASLNDLEYVLARAEIAEMPNQTDKVELFNQVSVLFEGDKEPEVYTLTDFGDTYAGVPGALSVSTPLGESLLGKKKGDEVEYTTVDELKRNEYHHKVTIVDIMPGNLDPVDIYVSDNVNSKESDSGANI